MDIAKAILIVARIEHELEELDNLEVGETTDEGDHLPPIRVKVKGKTFELGPDGIPVRRIR